MKNKTRKKRPDRKKLKLLPFEEHLHLKKFAVASKGKALQAELNRDIDERLTETPLFQSMSEKKIARTRTLINVLTVVGMLAVLIVGIWAWKNGFLTDKEKLAGLLKRTGVWAPLVFIFLQVVQCVIPIIPGGITLLIGVMVFGPWMGFIYNYIGIIGGSTAGFFLARMYGTTFVRAMVSEKSYQKYIGWLDRNQKRFDRFYMITMILPGMPDDLICMIAGLSKMRFRWFFVTLLWTKVPTILAYTLFLDKTFQWVKDIFGKFFY